MQKKQTMLIVDDEEINRIILTDYFHKEFNLLEAEDGQEALDYVYSQPVDIILLDLMMPKLNGFAVLDTLKAAPRYRNIPIVVTTGTEDNKSEALSMEKGAADYITKPYNPVVVRCRIFNVLGRMENELLKLHQSVQERRISEMQQIIDIDQLTGLLTQKTFLQQLPSLISENNHTRYYIVYLDIASFKLINELFNMETGDTILKTAASYFNTIIGKRGIATHLAADAFALLLPDELLDMDLLLQGLDAMMHSLSIYRTITFYAGIYPIDNIYLSPEKMLDRAHLAMVSARKLQTKRYMVYDDELKTKLKEEQMIAKEMEPAMLSGQFFVKFQPIYEVAADVSQAQAIAGEALLRWQHPHQGIISPKKFIPVFEKNGFISRIDRYAWEQACHFLSRQNDWGLTVTPVSINISHVNFYDVSFVDYLQRLLRKYDLKPWMLWLELTEKSYTHSPEQFLKTLRRLKSCGFQIIMDAFGSNFSSVKLLQNLSVDTIKIDLRSFYNQSETHRADIILASIIDMAEKLGIKVIIEGVETKELAEKMLHMGCHTMQGFYFSKPLTSDNYIEFLSHDS